MWIVMALAALPLPLQLLRWLRNRLQAARSCDNLPGNISLAAAEQRTNS
jgi:hypothetical protein